ncbi:MAG: aromatic amino acid lyase [Thiohalospira sp.]
MSVLLDGRRPSIAEVEALADRGWAPWEPAAKDGLALVNGTAAMTGIAALNAAGARREAWRPELGELRPHPGQQAAHARLNELATGSRRLVAAGPAFLPDDRPLQPAMAALTARLRDPADPLHHLP